MPSAASTGWITVKEAAARLGYSPENVTLLCRQRKLEARRAVKPARTGWREWEVSAQSVRAWRQPCGALASRFRGAIATDVLPGSILPVGGGNYLVRPAKPAASYSVREAAKLAACSTSTIHRLLWAGILGGWRTGRRKTAISAASLTWYLRSTRSRAFWTPARLRRYRAVLQPRGEAGCAGCA